MVDVNYIITDSKGNEVKRGNGVFESVDFLHALVRCKYGKYYTCHICGGKEL